MLYDHYLITLHTQDIRCHEQVATSNVTSIHKLIYLPHSSQFELNVTFDDTNNPVI